MVKRKLLIGLLVLALLAVPAFAIACEEEPEEPGPSEPGPSEPGPSEPEEPTEAVEVVYQAIHPRPQALTADVILPFVEGLEENSGGWISVTYYDAGGVVPLPGTMDAIATNVLQMGTTYPAIEPGRYPLADVTTMPFTVPSATIASQAIWHLYETFPEWQEEYPDEVVVLTMFSSALNQIHTTFPVTSLADLQGKKIIGLAPTSLEVISLLDAVPLSLLIQDAYDAIDKGEADGIICPLAPVVSLKISEICPYTTIINLSCDPFTISMNRDAFESLPADVQQMVLDASGAELSRAAGYVLDTGSESEAQLMSDQGNTFSVLSAVEMADFVALVSPLVDDWLAEMADLGKPGQEVLDELLSYVAQLEAEGEYIPVYPID
jgi:TRAP-type C4-dicarboxylate transport system substrate-binding protein